MKALRIAVLVKQIPLAETFQLGARGLLERQGLDFEMNSYCRRAVGKGVELARASHGTCVVVTLGPPSAEDVLREAIAFGATSGIHLCGKAFSGSDTLATSKALAAALSQSSHWDLILVGRNSLDGDTGQVGPGVAQLLDLPFACGVREIEIDGQTTHLRLEHDDGGAEVDVELPAVFSVAERLCDPCKMDRKDRAAVSGTKIKRLGPDTLGPGPWGLAASPTKVGAIKTVPHVRHPILLGGSLKDQVKQAVSMLQERGVLDCKPDNASGKENAPLLFGSTTQLSSQSKSRDKRRFVVLLEPKRFAVSFELIAAARKLCRAHGTEVLCLGSKDVAPIEELAKLPVDEVIIFEGTETNEDLADAISLWSSTYDPEVFLAPSTAFGREVAARVAASLGAGLVGDAIGLSMQDNLLVALKPAFSGAQVAEITFTSQLQMATVRPGVFDVTSVPKADVDRAKLTTLKGNGRRRVRVRSTWRDDDVEVLSRAKVVIGVGSGVTRADYGELDGLCQVLGAELGASRKVTDRAWMPHSRQIGITGRHVGPSLYVAIGISGKFNHMVGVRSAKTILAINQDPTALVFSQADIGIVGDWHQAVDLLERSLRFVGTI